jgi:Rrf2 family transcriptional regulator, iron-sulfur cluster assembly transcription factor
MLNQSADHALRAVLFVAREGADEPCSAELIASQLDVPRNYLGKLLNTLAQTGVLQSTRGPRGGFRLAVSADRLSLARVVEPFHRLPERRSCLLGNGACNPSNPCESHARWQAMSDHLTAFFEKTTVATMLGGTSGVPAIAAGGAGGPASNGAVVSTPNGADASVTSGASGPNGSMRISAQS